MSVPASEKKSINMESCLTSYTQIVFHPILSDIMINCNLKPPIDAEDSTLSLPSTAPILVKEEEESHRMQRGVCGNRSGGSGKRGRRKNKQPSSTRTNTDSAQMVYRQIPVLSAFYKSKNPRFKKELLHVSPEAVKAFSSLASNVLSGSVPLKRGASKTLRISKVQQDLKLLANPKTSAQMKRNLLLRRGKGSYGSGQQGGFLPLLGAVIPTVASLLGAIVTSATATRR